MARKRKGVPISGWLAIDKPLGMSSSQVVGKVRRILNAQKAGHGGTLDPLATGILPIALGEATKTSAWVMDGRKAYEFTVKLGEATTTEDTEGDVIETSDHRPSADEIKALLPQFTGDIDQVPPRYSALKIDGQRAYKLARDGQEVEMKSRRVTIYSIELIDMPDADHAAFLVHCGKGTYVRSLGRDIAKAAGSCGHISLLRRVVCGPFNESNAISLGKLEDSVHIAPQSDYLLPIETALDDVPALALTEDEENQIRHGQPITPSDPALKALAPTGSIDLVLAQREGHLIALSTVENGILRSLRVINRDVDEE